MAYNPNIHHRRSIRLKGYDYSQAGMYFITICVQHRHCLFGEIVGADLRVCPNNTPANTSPNNTTANIPADNTPANAIPNDTTGNTIMNIPADDTTANVCPNNITTNAIPDNTRPSFRENNSDKQIMTLNNAGKMIEKWFRELENKFPDIKCEEFVVMPNHFHGIIINTGNDSKKYDMGVSDFGKQISGEYDAGEHNSGEHDAGEHNSGEHVGSPLRTIIQWFKTMTTNEYIRGVKTLGWEPFNGKLWERNYWEHIIRDEKSFENITKYIINNPKNWNSDKLK